MLRIVECFFNPLIDALRNTFVIFSSFLNELLKQFERETPEAIHNKCDGQIYKDVAVKTWGKLANDGDQKRFLVINITFA